MKPRDVDAYIKALEFKPAVVANIEENAQNKYKEFMSLQVIKRTGLKEIAADWGLAIDACNKMDAKQLIRLCIAAKEI